MLFFGSLNDFYLGVRTVCSSLWDDMGLKLIHKTLRFVKAISVKSLSYAIAML